MADRTVIVASDSDAVLLSRWARKDESALKSLVDRHQKSAFAAAFYWVSGNRNAAYDITVSAFIDVLNGVPSAQALEGKSLLPLILRDILGKCRAVKSAAAPPMDMAAEDVGQNQSLKIMQNALFALAFEDRTLLLLRDQAHLSYEDIAQIMGLSVKDAKFRMLHARNQFRDKITEILQSLRGPHGVP